MHLIILNFVFLYCLLITMTMAEHNSRKQVHDLIMKTIRRIKTKRETFHEVPSYKYLPINSMLSNYDGGKYVGGNTGLGHIMDYANGNVRQSGLSAATYNLISKGGLPHPRYTSVFGNPLQSIGANTIGGLKIPPTSMSLAYFNQGHNGGTELLSNHGALPGPSYIIGNANELSSNMKQELAKYLSQTAPVSGYTDNANIINALTSKQPLSQISDHGPTYAIGHKGLGHFGAAYKQFDTYNPLNSHLDGKLTSNSFNPTSYIGNLNSGSGTLSHYMPASTLNDPIQGHDYSGSLTYSPGNSQEAQYSIESNNGIHETASPSSYVQPAKTEGIVFKKTHFID